ncbi:PEP-CTERM sorting domain-containing protein [Mucisphaera sp.]|uniref:PEP-CTERM sorting domain-containing protein n=1 Tax=Mucisphaera sp. TaxID=2913024 RepID=UPI003D0F5EB0
MKTQFALAAALGLIASGSASAALITDNFEVDSSANYTVVSSDGDNTSTFAFDYVAAGIPLAPRSNPGDTSGLKFTANDNDGSSSAITAFHNTAVAGAPGYKVTVDVWMNFVGTSGTTEYANIGVSGDGATANSIFLPIAGSGMFHSFTGDGGSGSDHRWFLDSANGGPLTVPGSDPSYLAGSANGTAALYQGIFPEPENTVAGSPGNNWVTVELTVNQGSVQVAYNGTTVIDGVYTGSLDGLMSLGYADVFSSVSLPENFGVYDNLVVEVVPEPASAALLGLAGLALTRRR